jgi:hypothetical protein
MHPVVNDAFPQGADTVGQKQNIVPTVSDSHPSGMPFIFTSRTSPIAIATASSMPPPSQSKTLPRRLSAAFRSSPTLAMPTRSVARPRDLDDGLVLLDYRPLFDEPLDHLALSDPLADVGQLELEGFTAASGRGGGRGGSCHIVEMEEEWYPLFLDDLMASAAMGRLLHHAHVMVLEGHSYRNPPGASREFAERT